MSERNGSIDTFTDAPQFVPADEARNAQHAAHAYAQQRDRLATENDALRRQVEVMQHTYRDDGTPGAQSRRITLLREALAKKDSEILALKTHHATRERAMHEARDAVERLRLERTDLEERLRSREGVFQAIEQERAALGRALENARYEQAQASSVLQQAGGTVQQWRLVYEERTRERDSLHAQLAAVSAESEALRAALETANTERSAMIHAHAREMAALSEQLQADADNARTAAAIATRATDDEHAEQVASLTQAHAETVAAMRRAHDETLATLRNEHAAAIAARDAELETLREEHCAIMESIRATMETAVDDATRATREEADTANRRAAEFERDLFAAREALGTYATDTIARVETAEARAREAEMFRDRYARKMAAALDQVKALRAESDDASRAQADSARSLGALAGKLTTDAVVRIASEHAVRAGRKTLAARDVEVAIAEVAARLPPGVADELRAQREVFVSPALAE